MSTDTQARADVDLNQLESQDGTKRNVFHTSPPESSANRAVPEICIAEQRDPERTTPSPQTDPKPLPEQQFRTWNPDCDKPDLDTTPVPAQVGFNDLSEKQVQALDLLFSGLRFSQIATVAGIGRTTLHRWRTQHPAFIAAYNRRQKEALDAISIRVATLLDHSLQQFEAIFAGQKTKTRRVLAANRILKTFGSRRLLQPAGPTNGPAVLRHLALQRRAESCNPLTRPLTNDELTRLLDELQYELRDVVCNKYSHVTAMPPVAQTQPT